MVKIDLEFKNLIPPLTEEERKGLEESLLKEGCRDALVLWGDTLIDGHNRYEICKMHNIPFETVQREFYNRQAAIEWIILNQFGRRNLPIHERARLALRLKPVIAEKAAERMLAGKSDPTQKSAQGETRDNIASIAGVSHDTIAKVEKIESEAPAPVKNLTDRFIQSVNKSC